MEPTTEVPPGESPRAHYVDRVVGGEVGEERVVEDIAADEPEVSEQEEREGEQHVTGGGEEEKRREDRPPDGEHHEESPLRAGEIGDGPEHGGRQEHDQRPGSDGEGPEVLTGPFTTEEGEPFVADDLGSEIGGENGGQDRRGICRVRPVVGYPGPDAARIVLVLGGHDWRNIYLAWRRCAAA